MHLQMFDILDIRKYLFAAKRIAKAYFDSDPQAVDQAVAVIVNQEARYIPR